MDTESLLLTESTSIQSKDKIKNKHEILTFSLTLKTKSNQTPWTDATDCKSVINPHGSRSDRAIDPIADQLSEFLMTSIVQTSKQSQHIAVGVCSHICRDISTLSSNGDDSTAAP